MDARYKGGEGAMYSRLARFEPEAVCVELQHLGGGHDGLLDRSVHLRGSRTHRVERAWRARCPRGVVEVDLCEVEVCRKPRLLGRWEVGRLRRRLLVLRGGLACR